MRCRSGRVGCRARVKEPTAPMGLTITLGTARWEAQVSLLYQLEYRPVLQRWRTPAERGFLFKFLVLVVRVAMGPR